MILSAQNLSKTFAHPQRVELFRNLSLEIKAGESIAISGRSGEGKTTLLHILGGLEFPDSGTVSLSGQNITRSNADKIRSRHIGFVFQTYNLLEDFTALENVLMPAKIARLPWTREMGLKLLREVGLEHRADFPAKLLSGGERQRVALARALCNNPDLILADEPSGNLDHQNAAAISQLLFSFVREKKKSLILVTHDLDLAAKCDRNYLLSDGALHLLPEPSLRPSAPSASLR